MRSYRISEVFQSRLTLCDPVDCSPPGSSVHGILQARILEWVAISFLGWVLIKRISTNIRREPGLPRWYSGKESACQCRRHKRHGFNSWVRNIPWRRKWQPTPVFLPRKSHGQRSLVGYSPWSHKEHNSAHMKKEQMHSECHVRTETETEKPRKERMQLPETKTEHGI